MKFCPYCRGEGFDEDQKGTLGFGKDGRCESCGGTGDLMRHLLEESYRLGRDDALYPVREVYKVLRAAGTDMAGKDPPFDLKNRMGLGP